MLALPIVIAIDAAGRMRPSMLSDQQLMELLFTADDATQARSMLAGDEDDACSWKGIMCTDDGRNVTEVSWDTNFVQFKGEMNFAMLPPKLTNLSLYRQPIRGSMNISHLPSNLRILCFQSTELTGAIDFGSLPRTLEQLFITNNEVASIRNIANLPEVMQYFYVREPNVTPKSVWIGRLHKSRLKINLQGCGITDLILEDEGDSGRVCL